MPAATGVADAKQTLEMQVANTGFLVDRMGKDCHPLQFVRELTQNAIEAIRERADGRGEVVWDADWNTFELTGQYKLACIDTGVGMTGEEMLQYINQLSSSTREQAHDKNFGVGAKVAAATRNHAGLLYLSWKNDEGWMLQLWKDPETGQYGARRWHRQDETWVDYERGLDNAVKPDQIKDSGTMVVLFGNDMADDTMEAPEGASSPSMWVARYLNTRYFRFPDGVTVRARQGWKEPRANTDTNVLRTLLGQEAYLEKYSESKGSLELDRAMAHWWILKDTKALTQNSGYIASSGHMAALYQDELYEMITGRGGVARLQSFGVIFGHNRVVIYVEPDPDACADLTSSVARTHLLIDEMPLPWADWAAEFRENMPEQIKDLMEEVTSGSTASDHKQAIKERLKQIRDLMRISRYRPARNGAVTVTPETTVGGHPRATDEPRNESSSRSGGRGGRAGGIYSLFVGGEDDIPANSVLADTDPHVIWITERDGTRTKDVLEDRAARYLADQNHLLINGDFRVFTDMIDRWEARYPSVPGARRVIEETVREWFEQALVETIIGAQGLQGSPHWTVEDIKHLWSEEALTAAALQRYHIDNSIKRGVGSRLGSTKEAR